MPTYSKIRSGHKLWLSSIIHDDGTISGGMGGGKTTGYFSLPGMGKSTLLAEGAELCSFFRSHHDKRDLIDDIVAGRNIDKYEVYPETAIWRIRDSDNFANIIKQNWDNSFREGSGMPEGKDFHLWVHEADDVLFYGIDDKHHIVPINNLPQMERYSDSVDLIKRLHWGSINAVLEPQTYKLSPTLVVRLKEKKMDVADEYEREVLDVADEEDRDGRTKRGKAFNNRRAPPKSRRKLTKATKYDKLEISPAYFWFEMIMTALEINRNRHMTFFIDEWDDVAEARTEGTVWKLVDILANNWKSLRRANISAHLTTHQTDFVDWRILKRMEYLIWMKGGIVRDTYSMITAQELVSGLPVGSFIIEFQKIQFGLEQFPAIPRKQPNVRIEGLKGQQQHLTNKEIRMLLKQMEDTVIPEAVEA